MIRFEKGFYCGKSLRFRKLHTVRKLKQGKPCKGIKLIIKADIPGNLFEIIDGELFAFSYYRKKDIFVYGMAGNDSEASELLLKIIEDKVC